MPSAIRTELIDGLRPLVGELVMGYARRLPHLQYADIRLEIGEGKYASSENGSSKGSGEDTALAFGIRVLAALLVLRSAPANLFLEAGHQEELVLGFGEHNSADVAAGHDHASSTEAPASMPPRSSAARRVCSR